MGKIRWNSAKNKLLKAERGISFETVIKALDQGGLLAEYSHPNQERYPNQRIDLLRK